MELLIGFIASKLAIKGYRSLRGRHQQQQQPQEAASRPSSMDLLGQVRQGLAKAVQKCSENQVFHDFPECSILGSVNRLSIKLKDANVHDMLQNWGPQTRFEVITFLIRDEDNRKQTLMTAELISGNGLVLKNQAGKQVMVVRLPNNDPGSFGKLMHPAPATLYKVSPSPTPIGTSYKVHRATTTREEILYAEKVPVSLYQIGKMTGFLGSNCAYWVKKSTDGGVLGYIHPKLVMKGNTLIVKFITTNPDPQVRCTILGLALLLLISEVYPQLRAMLSESVRRLDPLG